MSRLQSVTRILFWDNPKPKENSAQTIVRVLGNLVRSALSLIVIASLVLGAVIWIQNLPNEDDRAMESLLYSVAYDPSDECSADHPAEHSSDGS
jgi:protein-S-isoprenylcysteine O-methyltransferase Ste14